MTGFFGSFARRARGVRLLVFAAAVLMLASGTRAVPAPNPPNLIGGPFARLLASSADLGPARSGHAQLTVALRDPTRPVELIPPDPTPPEPTISHTSG